MVGEWQRQGLSLTMMRALAQIRREPGKEGSTYHGRWRTIDALRRRRLVAVSADRTVLPTDAGKEIHLHAFRTTLHIDGCHFYRTAGRCEECGATYHSYGERDLKNDPYSAIWMEPDPDAEEPCRRCEELMNGARPMYEERVFVKGSKAA